MLQTGLYFNLSGPSYVYVRFRCNRCKRMGEQLINEDKWDPEILSQPVTELSEEERRRFENLGPITPEEVIDFHQRLENLDDLAEIVPERAPEEKKEGE